jgi:hypothetical protein
VLGGAFHAEADAGLGRERGGKREGREGIRERGREGGERREGEKEEKVRKGREGKGREGHTFLSLSDFLINKRHPWITPTIPELHRESTEESRNKTSDRIREKRAKKGNEHDNGVKKNKFESDKFFKLISKHLI